jgi:hypothetical protein
VSDYYKTGDVTLTVDGLLRIYIREEKTCGYAFKTKGSPAHFVVQRRDSPSLMKNSAEPVITSLDDVMEAIRATYGKEIR